MKTMFFPVRFALGMALTSLMVLGQPVHLDLTSLFDTDAVLQAGGTPLSDPLAPDLERIDGQTLPASHQDGTPSATMDGQTSFLFAPLRSASRDAVAINGQTLTVPNERYDSLDLALLAAPGSYGNPFTTVELRYADGSTDAHRFGPVPGWLASPTAFDHTFFSYTDSSGVEMIIEFNADFGAVEAGYIFKERGNGNAGGVRFVDGTGYVLYDLPIDPQITQATLGITVGNNFVISLAADYADPEFSLTEGYTVVANSMELHDGFEHRALGNLRLYEFDLAPFLAGGSGGVYLLLTDATPENGWGPYIQNVSVYTGENLVFGETLAPVLNASQATVYAEFLTNGDGPEAPYLYDNSGSGPSNRGHRFADGGGSLTYRFDLPDDVSEAQLTVDMANNFVVALSGPIDQVRYALVTPGAVDENQYLLEEGNSVLGGNFRFADGTAYMIYEFDLPDELTSAVAQITVGNQFVIEVAAGDGPFVLERDYVAETGVEIRDNSNLDIYEIELDNYLISNPANIVRIRLSDGLPADGWGPYLTRIAIVNQPGTGEAVFETVLRSTELFGGLDIRNERNKAYYTIDLSPILQSNNPNKEVYVKFTDGSTGDGWGPGLFWMAVHSGPIEFESDRLIYDGLKAMNGEPEVFGLTLLQRRYAVDPSKTLQQIVLPTQPTGQSAVGYLLAVTLNPPATDGVQLNAQLGPDQALRLSWPVSAEGYQLESTSNLAEPWTAVGATPSVEADQWVVTLLIEPGARFFRLNQ
jgi:hypothetical protein